jgi:hypothetical protein
MIALSSLRTANLVMADAAARTLRDATAQPAAPPTAATIVRIENRVAGQMSSVAFGLAASQSLFDPSHLDVTKMKIDLMEKVGKAFGFDLDDFKDMRSMAAAIEGELAFLDPEAISAIERDLGLDELGVSLTDVLDAMKDPDGTGGDRLEAALLERLGVPEHERTFGPRRLDDIGRYGYPW